ncbi:hypothetical protein LKL35_36525 [Streptomyces sp. ET3-23]|uniref:hypothetical protein n=1 Tax=Streptomyces sp. ET3-23 TaxID=2885643 RepID=UPI001D0F8628|nr:hypothetical protein [Streptomyces sp. ET3-23]MCC2280837.1 hypothetical protein [Streptomyces sp. ET3-23]
MHGYLFDVSSLSVVGVLGDRSNELIYKLNTHSVEQYDPGKDNAPTVIGENGNVSYSCMALAGGARQARDVDNRLYVAGRSGSTHRVYTFAPPSGGKFRPDRPTGYDLGTFGGGDPTDMAVSADGRWVYTVADTGNDNDYSIVSTKLEQPRYYSSDPSWQSYRNTRWISISEGSTPHYLVATGPNGATIVNITDSQAAPKRVSAQDLGGSPLHRASHMKGADFAIPTDKGITFINAAGFFSDSRGSILKTLFKDSDYSNTKNFGTAEIARTGTYGNNVYFYAKNQNKQVGFAFNSSTWEPASGDQTYPRYLTLTLMCYYPNRVFFAIF